MVEAVNSEAYAKTSGTMLDTCLTASAPFREATEKAMLQALQQLSMPSRADFISLAERFTNVEMRLDDMDAKLDRIEKQLTKPAGAGSRVSRNRKGGPERKGRDRNGRQHGCPRPIHSPGRKTHDVHQGGDDASAIAQTPKELVWALNKAKLYRYVPVVPEEQRHRVPLLLVFALMNRPYILDLRPGHSFVEFMISRGYDLYLLDWGAPGPEDKNLKFDDYTLDYLPRAIRKLKAVAGRGRIQHAGLVYRGHPGYRLRRADAPMTDCVT